MYTFKHQEKRLRLKIPELPFKTKLVLLLCPLFSCSVPGKLKQFVLDLHSGKLHREFHHGPDPTDTTPRQVRQQCHPCEIITGWVWLCHVKFWIWFLTLRRRQEKKWPAAPQRVHSRSWRPARLATPSSFETETSCDLNSLPAILWLNATPQGLGGG